MTERVALLWNSPHCGCRSVNTTTIQGTATKGSKRRPLRFHCSYDGCKVYVRLVSKQGSHIIAAVPVKHRDRLRDLAKSLDVGKTEIDAARIWDRDWLEGDPLPFPFRRWKSWVGVD